MSIFNPESAPLDKGPPANIATELIKQVDTLTEEVEFLRFVYARSITLPDPILATLKSDYLAQTGKRIPPGY